MYTFVGKLPTKTTQPSVPLWWIRLTIQDYGYVWLYGYRPKSMTVGLAAA